MKTAVVVGGGVAGILSAILLKRDFDQVTLIEKEGRCGWHASGRNSGVLHAGFYYTADSLKARFTRDGNREMTQYCLDRGLRINRCGKLVVARDADELRTLDELLRRGRVNGVELHEVSEAEARRIEPRAKTYERALFSPTTSSVDPEEVMQAVEREARTLGVQIQTDTAYLGRDRRGIRTSSGTIAAGYVINASGLYADKIARDFGFSGGYRIIPFKGLYLYSDESPGALRAHIYPVPDLGNPFLGVHFTLTAYGRIKIGPTAIPAFWREHYRGFDRFSFREMCEIVSQEAALWLRNDFGFRRLARQELAKYRRKHMVRLASELAAGVRVEHFRSWGAPGIRAQLYDLRARRLEMDFRHEGDARSFHVLNAVSPAFTCCMPFARYVFERIEDLIGAGSSAPAVVQGPS